MDRIANRRIRDRSGTPKPANLEIRDTYRAGVDAAMTCPCCGGNDFVQSPVLWPALVEAWELSPEEHRTIDRQQGYHCARCGTNLRSAALAVAIAAVSGHPGLFRYFPLRHPTWRVLEINEAGNLHKFLRWMPRLTITHYPDVDFTKLPYPDATFDLIVHSDVLEHVEEPLVALREGFRVLRTGAWMCYTVPMVVGRLTRTTDGRTPTFHGTADEGGGGMRVRTEYGADFWTAPVEVGFREVRLFSFEYPAALALAMRKPSSPHRDRQRSAHSVETRLKRGRSRWTRTIDPDPGLDRS